MCGDVREETQHHYLILRSWKLLSVPGDNKSQPCVPLTLRKGTVLNWDLSVLNTRLSLSFP